MSARVEVGNDPTPFRGILWLIHPTLVCLVAGLINLQVADAQGLFVLPPPPEPERFLQSGVHYYAVQNLNTGEIVWQGQTQLSGIAFGQISLAPNTPFRFWILQAGTFAVANPSIVTPRNGESFEVPEFDLQLRNFKDRDDDGLHDIGEFILGTINDPANENTKDTDGDGISDGAEVELGLDPWDGVGGFFGLLSAVQTSGAALDVASFNDVVVVADSPNGVSIFNIFNGMDPVIIAQVETPGEPKAVAVSGNLVGVADGTSGLTVIDFSDPPAARISARAQLSDSAQAIAAAANLVFVGTSDGLVFKLDLPTAYVFDLLEFGEAVQDLFLAGDHLYVLVPGRLHIVNIDQGAFDELGSVATSSDVNSTNGRMRLFVGGGIAYVVDRNGYHTIDVSDPENPFEIASDPTGQFGWKQIVLDGSGRGLAAVSPNQAFDGPHNVAVYDVSDPAVNDAFQTEFVTPGVARAVSIYNGIAYVADHSAGMQSLRFVLLETGSEAPSIDLELGFSDNEVEEGQLARVTALVADDVMVRNVEFYIDGRLVATDGNYPFEYRLIAPRIADQDSFLLQARASDTAGNASFTDELTIDLLSDSTPPIVLNHSPRVGARSVGSIAVFFNEPLDPNSVSAGTIQLTEAGEDAILGTSDDVDVNGGISSIRDSGTVIDYLLSGSLPFGRYRVTISNTITDRAGNAIVEPFVFEFLVGDANYWVGFFGGLWDDPGNWSEEKVPDADDNVVLGHVSGAVILDGGDITIKSLASAGDFTLNSGNLTVTENVKVERVLRVESGQLTADTIKAGTGPNAAVVLGSLQGLGRIKDTHILTSNSVPLIVQNGRLDGVTVDGAIEVTGIGSRMYVESGLTLDGTLLVPESSRLIFDAGTQVLDGNAAISLRGIFELNANSALTIGPSVAISGYGFIRSSTIAISLINQGTIRADVSGKELLIHPRLFTNEGVIEVTGGGIVEVAGDWSNTGTLRVDGGVLELGGSFATDDIGTIDRVSGSVNITGTLDNTGKTLVNAATGDWVLNNGSGTVVGGMITNPDGAILIVKNGTLDGVTVSGAIEVTGIGSRMYVENGLTLDGTLLVPESARLTFDPGTQILDGNAAISLRGIFELNANSALTIGPSVAISGYGFIRSSTIAISLINQGTIRADVSGKELLIHPRLFTNEGVIEVTGGGIVEVAGDWSNTGTLRVDGGVLELGGSFATDGIGTIDRVDGPVEITGTLDNTGKTLAFNETTGDWVLSNVGSGPILGGTITTSGSAKLIVGNGLLDGVTVEGAVEMLNNGRLRVQNGLTLNGTLLMPESAEFIFNAGTQTLGGNAEITFRGTLEQNAGSALTIGPNVVISGFGVIRSSTLSISLINQGTIRSDTSGKEIWFDQPVFRNESIMEIRKGALFKFAVDMTSAASASIEIEVGGPAGTQFGRLQFTKAADLLGTLAINVVDGYEPVLNQELQIVTFDSLINPFTTVTGTALPNGLKFDLIYGTNDVTLKVIPGP